MQKEDTLNDLLNQFKNEIDKIGNIEHLLEQEESQGNNTKALSAMNKLEDFKNMLDNLKMQTNTNNNKSTQDLFKELNDILNDIQQQEPAFQDLERQQKQLQEMTLQNYKENPHWLKQQENQKDLKEIMILEKNKEKKQQQFFIKAFERINQIENQIKNFQDDSSKFKDQEKVVQRMYEKLPQILQQEKQIIEGRLQILLMD